MTVDAGYELAEARRELRVLRECTYLNTGTVGVMAEPVLAEHLEAVTAFEAGGHLAQSAARDAYEKARAALATLIGAQPEEIALTRNATDGVNLIAAGLALDPDAVALTTDQEHPAVILPWALAERRGGAQLRLFRIGATPEETLENFRAALSPSVKLVVVSHVSCETGARLPVAEMCRLARERGIWTLVDGAQSVGQFPVDVAEIGCDFMTGNGHKWLCGPKGTGFLFLRRGVVGQVEPRHVGDGAVAPHFNRHALDGERAELDFQFVESGQRFEFGTRNWHTFAALPAAIDYLAGLGWSAIERHGAGLSAELKQRLTDAPGVTLHSPRAWEDSSGLVTFAFEGWTGEALSQALWQRYAIIQRRVQIPNGVRISCAYFNDSSDLDRLFAALGELRAG
ncbi:MAG TPA: aminotransferase class V-fold PLP-dependent enzyme [Thermomicrobiaceae bacterium]|nr:aminotransferase class V-fold PLP-dependent enzyme [Thermomicrobiaceae bacterium]